MRQYAKIIQFVALAYLFGFMAQFAFFFHRDQSFWLVLTMWAPTLAVCLTGAEAREMALTSLKKAGFAYFPVAFLVGFGVYAAVQIFWFVARLGTLNAEQTVKHYLLVLTVNPIFTGLLGALGEEIGWRGFLQPALEKRFKPLVACLIVGAIWAYWHLPANLAGHNGPEHPFWNAWVIFPTSVIFMTLFFGWIRDRSGSVWPCVYLHGVVNSVSNSWVITANSELTEKLTTTMAWTIVGLTILWCCSKQESRDDRRLNQGATDPWQ